MIIFTKNSLRFLLAFCMVFAGVAHFRTPEPFVKIVPGFLSYALALVYISGFFEIVGGIGLLIPKLKKWAGIGLIALFIAVFPANISMAINHIPWGDTPVATWQLWLRLPLQLVFILWAWWVSR